MDYGTPSLPLTGAGVIIGGLIIDQVYLLSVAIIAVALIATLLRVGYRRGKPLHAR
jgi:hypothetical protein